MCGFHGRHSVCGLCVFKEILSKTNNSSLLLWVSTGGGFVYSTLSKSSVDWLEESLTPSGWADGCMDRKANAV